MSSNGSGAVFRRPVGISSASAPWIARSETIWHIVLSEPVILVSVQRDPRIVGEDRGTAVVAVHRSPARIWA
jgi:hypothetical protein